MPKLKLSEAIALNGMTKPQGRGFQFVGSLDSPCAIGGALQAIGKQVTNSGAANYSIFEKEWPWTSAFATCPVSGEEETVRDLVWKLNDRYEWTRQQIAAWIARIEPADIPANVTCEATVVQNCEDQTGELCGKTCVEGSYLCEEHHAEVEA